MTEELVTLPKQQVALLAKGARLFEEIFEATVSDECIDVEDALYHLIQGASDLGVAVDREATQEEREDFGVETVVELGEAFKAAMSAAEKACGLVPRTREAEVTPLT